MNDTVGKISLYAKKQNFSNFDFEIFSPIIEEGEKKSPRYNMVDMFAIAEDMSLNLSNTNLLMYGSTGTGKTYLSNCIANHFEKKGLMVRIYSSLDMFQYISNSLIHRENVVAYDEMRECDLLIIDNLGNDIPNEFTVSQLCNLIDYRIMAMKPTIITSNLTVATLGRRYTQRLLSRIIGHFRCMKFIGNDFRWEFYK